MRRIHHYILILLVFPFIFQGCKKDDNSQPNEFVFGESTYSLTSGIIEYYGQFSEDEGVNFDVSLFTSGLEFDEDADEVTGMGSAVYFQMYSSSNNNLESGTYLFANSAVAGSFDVAIVAIDWDPEAETGTQYPVTEGVVEVSVSSNTYEITFNLVAGGQAVMGYYKGPLSKIEFKKATEKGKVKRFR